MTTATQIEAGLKSGAGEFVNLLNGGLLDNCVKHMNASFVLPHMAKLPSEQLPTHQRNLTDARTRIGGLLEYSFGLALQHQFDAAGVGTYRVSFVVANQYPDLLIRSHMSEPLIRVEMKAIELASEEKAANFDALVRDVHPERDILCVLLWEWAGQNVGSTRVDVPEVRCGFAFEAYPIARIRDLGWLAERDADAVKAIDIVGPVVGKVAEHAWKEEEHNMGKLMRIGGDVGGALPSALAAHPANAAYSDFKRFTISAGLAYNAAHLLNLLGYESSETTTFVHSHQAIQTISRVSTTGNVREVIVAAAGRLTPSRLRAYANELSEAGVESGMAIVFSDKFSWSIYRLADGVLEFVERGRKFGSAVAKMKSLLLS